MNAPAIVPTITQRVRSFLAAEGAPLRPWAGLEETYDELYSLLQRRKDDPAFWSPLKALLEEVIRSTVGSDRPSRLTPAQAELLTSWKVDELVDQLRDALPHSSGGDVALTSSEFTRKLSCAVLGGFLLIGLAACSGDTTSPSTGTGAGGGDAAALEASASGGGAAEGAVTTCTESVPSAIDQVIGESTLSSSDKTRLCSCLARASSGWQTSLVDLFATGTPEEIAHALSDLISCCKTSSLFLMSESPTADQLAELRRADGTNYLCTVPLYKGVSFPD